MTGGGIRKPPGGGDAIGKAPLGPGSSGFLSKSVFSLPSFQHPLAIFLDDDDMILALFPLIGQTFAFMHGFSLLFAPSMPFRGGPIFLHDGVVNVG